MAFTKRGRALELAAAQRNPLKRARDRAFLLLATDHEVDAYIDDKVNEVERPKPVKWH